MMRNLPFDPMGVCRIVVICLLIFPVALYAAPTQSEEGASKESVDNWSPEHVSRLIREAGVAASASRETEKPEAVLVLGIQLEALQERSRKWLELKSLYAELISEMEKPAELAAEQAAVREEISAFRQNGLLQKPPYGLDAYDFIQAEGDALDQAEKTADLSLSASKKTIEQLQSRVQDAQKQWRNFQEQHAGDTTPAIIWQQEGIQLDIQLSEARRRIEQRKIENLKLERQTIDLRRALAQSKVKWVKPRLAYSADELKRHEAALEERKNELRQSLSDLAGKLSAAERNRTKAQSQVQDAVGTKKSGPGPGAAERLGSVAKGIQRGRRSDRRKDSSCGPAAGGLAKALCLVGGPDRS